MNREAASSPAGVRSRLVAAVVAALAALVAVHPQPAPAKPPELAAKAWVLIDADDGERLAGKAAGRSLPIASATKLMTAYVGLQQLDLDQSIPAADYDPLPVESVLGLSSGERLEFRDLLTAMMLPSANDAAVTVAEAASGDRDRFVAEMNRAAARLGLDDSSFANPIGLDDPDNFSSARDLASLAVELRRNRFFRKTVAKADATLTSGRQTRRIETRNTLLRTDSRVNGIKTGHTQGAGYVLVGSAEQRGTTLISVVLGTSGEAERDATSRQLLDYGFSLYNKRRPVERRQPYASLPIDGEDAELELVAARGVEVRARSDEAIETELEVPDQLDRAVDRGERLGVISVLVDGEPAGRAPLVAARALAAPSGAGGSLGGSVGLALIGGGVMVLGAAFVVALRRGGRRESEAQVTTAEQRARRQQERAQRRADGSYEVDR